MFAGLFAFGCAPNSPPAGGSALARSTQESLPQNATAERSASPPESPRSKQRTGTPTPTGSVPVSRECTAYCDEVDRVCNGRMYPTRAHCTAFCKVLGSDAIAERMAAPVYKERPMTSCAAKGPFGGGAQTELVCRVANELCPQAYASTASCEKQWPRLKGVMGPKGRPPPHYAPNFVRGNSWGCRLRYLVDAVIDPTAGCPNVSFAGGACSGTEHCAQKENGEEYCGHW